MGRVPFKVGYGYDIHRFVEARDLILGGVKLRDDYGLDGHSDADCLSHAIADSILGAAGLPDIGFYFPPSDPNIKNIDSQLILKKALSEIKDRGFLIGNIDATVIAERPKIMSFVGKMKKVLAKTLEIDESDIGIKATTNEKIGGLGEGAGIAASAVCLIYRDGF